MSHTILDTIVSICRSYPQILLFLSLAIGFYIGKIKIFGFSLGSTTSVLLVAILLGQMDVTIDPLIRTIAFALFIFTIGYKVGPHFFQSLKKEGLSYIILTVFFAFVALITAIILGKLFGFDKGTTAGLLSGSITQSSIIGTAEDAIQKLAISTTQKNILTSNIAVAHAITYIFGFAGVVLFYKLIPKILRIDLKYEARKAKAQLSQTINHTDTIEQHTKQHTVISDLGMIGLGCFIGTLIGLISIRIGSIPFTLGLGGGILMSGLFFGWLHTIRPSYGHIPKAAQWILTELGLNLFIACIGLTAAPRALHALQTNGTKLLLAGVMLSLIPHIVSILFGRKILKLNMLLLLGALAGAGTITPSLQVLKEESDSSIPALGYPMPYALANFILTIWGAIIIHLM